MSRIMDVALTFFLAIDDVLQEVNRDSLVWRQVDLNLHGEEVIAFPFALILCLEGLYINGCLLLYLHRCLAIVAAHDKNIM